MKKTKNQIHEITWTGVDCGDFVVNHERYRFKRISIRKYEVRRYRSSVVYLICTSINQAIKMIEDVQ